MIKIRECLFFWVGRLDSGWFPIAISNFPLNFFMTRCSGQLTACAQLDKIWDSEIIDQANLSVLQRFEMFGFYIIRTYDFILDKHLFDFSCSLGHNLAMRLFSSQLTGKYIYCMAMVFGDLSSFSAVKPNPYWGKVIGKAPIGLSHPFLFLSLCFLSLDLSLVWMCLKKASSIFSS